MALNFLNNGYFAGKVGIGTESPGAKLEVVGTTIIDGGTGVSSSGVFHVRQNGDGSSNGITITSSNATSHRIWKGANGTLNIGPSTAVSSFVQTLAGNVGIGRSSSITARLFVEGPVDTATISTSSTPAARINNGGAISNWIGSNGYNYGYIQSIQDDGSNNLKPLSLQPLGGNVGIGTTSPETPLHVLTNTTDNASTMLIQNGSTGDASIKFNISGDTYSIGIDNSDSDKFKLSYGAVGTNDRIVVDTSGNVGIGTTTPDALLEISGNAGADPGPITNPTTFRITDAGNAATGAGDTTNPWGKIEFYSEDVSASGPSVQTQISSIYDNIYSYASSLTFSTRVQPSTALLERMRIRPTGAIQFNAYDSTNNTGTPTYLLGTDASGNIVKTNTIPGSDPGPYLPLAGGTMTGNTVHNDNVKSIYGTASDGLEIYHDGTDSIIADTGTGNLYIRGAASMRLQGINQSNFLIASQGGNVNLYYNNANKFDTTNTGVNVTGEIQLNTKALLSNQENTDVDTGTETVANVAIATYTAAFFDFVIKKTTNVRAGTVYACHDGTNVEFTETSTQDLGDTSDVTLSVVISGTNMELQATTTSDNWSIKSLIRAI